MKAVLHLKVIAIAIALVVSVGLFIQKIDLRKQKFLSGANVVYKESQVLGVDSETATTNVDFSKPKMTSSNLIFGGAHAPKTDQDEAWQKIASVGITSIRIDIPINWYVPSNISLEQYKSNTNNVQSPQKWDLYQIKLVKDTFAKIKAHDMKSIAIMSYSVKWLNYSQTPFGVPKDWNVYEDLVKKSYLLFRSDIDYLEIWNEPDLEVFLSAKNSPLSKADAYHEIVRHAVKAIREVDNEINDGKFVQLGVGALAQPTDTAVLQPLLTDSELMKEISFVSYHNYEHIAEPSNGKILSDLNQRNLGSKKLMLTEWAHTPNIKKYDQRVMTDIAIPYAGSKLIDFMAMGLHGANYFAIQQIEPDSPRGDEGLLGFFETKQGKVELLPIARTWQLMSTSLGLGLGDNTLYHFDTSDATKKFLPWQNSQGKSGVVLTNSTSSPQTTIVNAYNLPISGKVNLTAYIASADHTGKDTVGSIVLPSSPSGVSFKIVAPPHSVVGVLFDKATIVDRLPKIY